MRESHERNYRISGWYSFYRIPVIYIYKPFLVKLVELPLQTYQPKRTVAHAMTFIKIIPTLSKLWWWFLKELLTLLTKRPLI